MTIVREKLEVLLLTNLCSQLVKNLAHQQKAIVTSSEVNHCKVECNPRNGDLNTTQLYPTYLFFCLRLLDSHFSPQSIERPLVLFFVFFGSLRAFVSPFTSPESIEPSSSLGSYGSGSFPNPYLEQNHNCFRLSTSSPCFSPPKKKQSTYSPLVRFFSVGKKI